MADAANELDNPPARRFGSADLLRGSAISSLSTVWIWTFPRDLSRFGGAERRRQGDFFVSPSGRAPGCRNVDGARSGCMAGSGRGEDRSGRFTGVGILTPRLTGTELLTYVGLLRGQDEQIVEQRAEELLDVLDLADTGGTVVAGCSTGMRKRRARRRATAWSASSCAR